jgi:hypothetical protein
MNFKWPLFFAATLQQREALNLQTMKQQAKKGTKNKKIYNTFCNFSPLQFLHATVKKVYIFQLENKNFRV